MPEGLYSLSELSRAMPEGLYSLSELSRAMPEGLYSQQPIAPNPNPVDFYYQ